MSSYIVERKCTVCGHTVLVPYPARLDRNTGEGYCCDKPMMPCRDYVRWPIDKTDEYQEHLRRQKGGKSKKRRRKPKPSKRGGGSSLKDKLGVRSRKL